MTKTQSPSFADHCVELRHRIDAALTRYTELPAGCPASLREALAYSLLSPGKRLRPLLVLMAAKACGGSTEAAMPAACAVEMVHAYSLVHDDLPAMDNDDLRRGWPTSHKKFGEAIAILSGDALLTMAFEVLASEVRPEATAGRCCAALAEAAGPCNMVGGQADDVVGVVEGIDVLESIHRRKTGAMIRVSLQIGGLVAGADACQLTALQQYGRRLGLAFQITDDLLDVCGDEATTGKRVGKDAQAAKFTFPGLLGIDGSRRRARQLIDEACEAIAPLAAGADDLRSLAQYVLERNR